MSFLEPSAWRIGNISLSELVGVASKRKPYCPHSAATLRVKVFRLHVHQKPAPSFASNGSTCLGSRLPRRADGQVAVEDVVNLRAVFEEEAVADAAEADVVAGHEVVRAVDREPPVLAVPDRVTDHGVAPHGVAAQVEVQGVAAERALLAQVAELGVGERPGRAAVIHGVPADTSGVGGFDHHIAAQVRDLAAEITVAEVGHLQRLVERDLAAIDRSDGSFLGGRFGLRRAVLLRAGEDDAIPTFQPVTGSASDTAVSPIFAVAPSFTQARLRGWPCASHRPPQQTIAGQLSLFIPST